MMKIAILTQPLRYNYGGILQNFALQTVLKRMGHEVTTLDPHRYLCKWWQYGWCSLKRLFFRVFYNRHDKPILWEWRIDKEIRLLGKNTFPFINRYIKRKEYSDLSKDVCSSQYDAFVVGSDQVWRSEYNTNICNMFLDFAESWNVKRIAYAASYGIDMWTGNFESTAISKRMLRKFDAVSVREQSGIEICKKVFGVQACHVLDPTLLLTKEDYISLLRLDKVPKSKGNLLVYILDYTENKKKLIELITKDYHLIPFRVNSDVEDYNADLSCRIQPSVKKWLRGFMDADYVVTDSFHACVFSVIFEKPFVVYGNESRGMTRFLSLLRPLRLEQYLITDTNSFEGFPQEKLLNSSKSVLEEMRRVSMEFLIKSLSIK